MNSIVQIRNKQAYIINGNTGVSYNTPVTCYKAGRLFVSNRYYSRTTSHHITDFKRYFNDSGIYCSESTLTAIIDGTDETAAQVLQEYQAIKDIITGLQEGRQNFHQLTKAAEEVQILNTGGRKFKKSRHDRTRYRLNFHYFKLEITRTLYWKEYQAGPLPDGSKATGSICYKVKYSGVEIL